MEELTNRVARELIRAKEAHPDWPLDAIYQAAILTEEAGEVTRAANQYVCEGGSLEALEEEVVQTAAMCFRMLEAIRAGKTLKSERGVRVYYKSKGTESFDDRHTVRYVGASLKDAEADFMKYNPGCEITTGIEYKLKL